MRFLKLTVVFVSLLFANHSIAQNAILDFTVPPQTYAGPGTYNPNYWANGGCPTYHQFGPNPLPVNGYNVRTSGGMHILPTFTNTSTTYHVSIYAFGNTNTGVRQNSAISVEYSFQANKSYLVEIEGVNDHSWDGNGTAGKRYNGVFWVKLDDNVNLPTTSDSPCEVAYTPVEKSVGRYSKLIADPDFSILGRNHQVKFSLKEPKSALKITFDASPYVPGIKIDNIFRLAKIKITEIPYEEDGPEYLASYTNVGKPRPWYEGYYIEQVVVLPTRPPAAERLILSIPSNMWKPNGMQGYSVYVSEIVPNVIIRDLNGISLYGDMISGIRGDKPELLPMPGEYQGNNYTYNVIDRDMLITVNNNSNTPPTSPVGFGITYY